MKPTLPPYAGGVVTHLGIRHTFVKRHLPEVKRWSGVRQRDGHLFDRRNVDRTVAALVVYAVIDALGDVGAALKDAKPESLERLYRELRVELKYQPQERLVDIQLAPRVVGACVRGGVAH